MTRRVTGQITFVLGGARSGKSAYAEALVQAHPPPWRYVATGQAFDAEMRERFATHQSRRSGSWQTVEAPFDLAAALDSPSPVLVDCLTLWVTNLLLAEQAPDWLVLLAALDARDAPTVLVSNEVGLGIVPDNALARRFRDMSGVLHAQVAARADRVVLMVAGIPMVVK
jgi:adenosylcobinamide kinase/adenosylcobinamide-phosphate guanylyltransferase